MRLFNKPSKQHTEASKPRAMKPTDHHGQRPEDAMFAIMRRYELRLSQLEDKLSTCRRDIWRVEKQLANKQAVLKQPQIENTEAGTMPPWLLSLYGGK